MARDFVDTAWSEEERAVIVRYLYKARVRTTYRGESRCRLCGRSNGCSDRTDGIYLWPSGFAHYVEAHGVKPSADFVAHVLGQRHA